MRLPEYDDFLSADGNLLITAHDANGVVSENAGRYSVTTFQRIASLTKKAIAVSVLSASAIGAAHAQGPQSESASNWFSSFLSTGSSKVVVDAGVDQFSKDVLMDSLSPSVKKLVSKIEIQSDEYHKAKNDGKSGSPEMEVRLENNSITCTMRLTGMKEAIQNIYNDDFSKLSAEDVQRSRKAVIRHEASHCELGAKEFQQAIKTNTAAVFRTNAADTFIIAGNDGINVLDRTEFAGTLMNERAADSRAILLTAQDTLGKLSESSSADDVKKGLDRFYEDSSFYYKMRTEEMKNMSENGITKDDHDTLHVIDSLISSIREEANNPKKFEKWKEVNLSDDGMNELATKMAVGSTIQERDKILLSQVNYEIDDTVKYVVSRGKIIDRDAVVIEASKDLESKSMKALQASLPNGSPAVTDEQIDSWSTLAGFRISSQMQDMLGNDFDKESKGYAEAKKKAEEDLFKKNPELLHARNVTDARYELQMSSEHKEQEERSLPVYLQMIKDLKEARTSLEKGFQTNIAMEMYPNDEVKVKEAVKTFNEYAKNSQPSMSITYSQKIVSDYMKKKSPEADEENKSTQRFYFLLKQPHERAIQASGPKP